MPQNQEMIDYYHNFALHIVEEVESQQEQMGKEQPKLNQIIFIDLDYEDEWDTLKRGRPCLITKINNP